MRNWIVTVFIFVLIITASLCGYYFWFLKSGNKTLSSPKPTLPSSYFAEGVLHWREALDLITSTCQEESTSYMMSDESVNYLLSLFSAIGKVSFNEEEKSFSGVGDEEVAFYPLSKKSGLVSTTYQEKSCWVAWVGNGMGGVGNIAYYTGSGKIQKYAIKNFPIIPAPETTPSSF